MRLCSSPSIANIFCSHEGNLFNNEEDAGACVRKDSASFHGRVAVVVGSNEVDQLVEVLPEVAWKYAS
ncbi:hypothetical protein PC116_g12844 [Phytophthora cactorum]|uniref:Uncharacterized protein n=1 Tax=Phytophthora cactorum TaxID=29920 RepID=A0A8T0Z6J4_9STRA|nr:hypothetical protein PC111_g10943 [Phytophthora cactorum]KAG2824432.1 hypothetical protein PC112_g10109 [Phytophthora cactorum]KAG2857499.1 hypothetical protein PC113_g10635 [Phytophthora cactorum]KAG2905764.1 hypothetical protein PC115_g14506 [Phytophthora cactorum]KAG2933499.1 hypothetical protein PC117_g12852 [Phytophthora cactorum]